MGAHRKVVERSPIEQLLDDRVLAVHAVILGADAPLRRLPECSMIPSVGHHFCHWPGTVKYSHTAWRGAAAGPNAGRTSEITGASLDVSIFRRKQKWHHLLTI
jgi:hypothetical protein